MQRLGLGRALMNTILEDAETKGFQSIFAGVSSLNKKAVKFHGSLGFKAVAELPRVGYKFGTWLDLTLMQKFLKTD
jgi:phosphinothricin acetyltransferase